VNYLAVNRAQLLAIATVLLLVFAIIHHIWANWGLITIHARQEPLGKVIASMERQGHAKIETDIPGDTPVTMDVVKVQLTDALETLSVTTDSRWRLLYFAAGDKSTLKSAELSWFDGQKPDGWKMVSFPMGGMGGGGFFASGDDDDPAPLDPRGDVWTPQTAAPAPVQNFFLEAAQLTNAGFAFPATWNPTVNSAPHPGTVNRVVPKLIRAAGGREDEVFFISKTRRGPRNPADATADTFRPDFDLLAERTQAEINRLPPDARSEAQANFDATQAFRKSLRNMTDDERRQAWQQHLQDPQVQQQFASQMDSRDSRMNHDQRMQHIQNYLTRKLTAMGKMQ
jgi:hypothetical protein